MDIEIKKLTPELAEDYLHFFDVTPHEDGAEESKCYCACWSSADHRVNADFSSRQKRRELAEESVKNGTLQGYLAYYEGKAVGWCNANTKAECLHCFSWLRFMQEIPLDEPSLKVKSVFCFVIAPQMRRKGIAAKLLERVCMDAEADGFDLVESYPKREFINEARDFMGPSEMYRKAGFTVYREINDNEMVMRKQLRGCRDEGN